MCWRIGAREFRLASRMTFLYCLHADSEIFRHPGKVLKILGDICYMLHGITC